MKINKEKAIELLERHKEISKILSIKKDEKLFQQIIEYINIEEDKNKGNEKTVKKATPIKMFAEIVESNAKDLTKFGVKKEIIDNKDNMSSYWKLINDVKRMKYTKFELNVIWHLISKYHIKYSNKSKDDIIYNI